MKKLSNREKKLVLLASAAAVFFIGFQFGISPLLDYSERIGKEIPQMERDLKKAELLRRLYLKINGEITGIRDRLDERQETFRPFDFLDKLARKEGLSLGKVSHDTNEDVHENYREDILEIDFEKVPLDKLVRFLHGIESSGHLLTVKELSITPDGRDSTLLNADITVSTFVKKADKEHVAGGEKVPVRAHR